MKEKSEKSSRRNSPYKRPTNETFTEEKKVLKDQNISTDIRKMITFKKSEYKEFKCNSDILCSLKDEEIRDLFSDIFPVSWSEQYLVNENLDVFRKVCKQYDFSVINEEILFDFSRRLLTALFPQQMVGKCKAVVGLFFIKRNKQKMKLFIEKVRDICKSKNKDDTYNRNKSEKGK